MPPPPLYHAGWLNYNAGIMDDGRTVPFLAPVFASALAPVAGAAEAVQRAVGRGLVARLGGVPEQVPCPACGAVCALWLNRRLYRPGRALGSPLGADHRDNVPLPCRCGRVWHSSGRGVYYRLRKGLPPLGALVTGWPWPWSPPARP